MKTAELRKAFLEYFKANQHAIVKSSSLVPHDDPTLLFTTAGMVQFKRPLLGEEKRGYVRATSSQKCMRAGGKSRVGSSWGTSEELFTMVCWLALKYSRKAFLSSAVFILP